LTATGIFAWSSTIVNGDFMISPEERQIVVVDQYAEEE
jgi:hypothetical protein